jgi:hypothetical protein
MADYFGGWVQKGHGSTILKWPGYNPAVDGKIFEESRWF